MAKQVWEKLSTFLLILISLIAWMIYEYILLMQEVEINIGKIEIAKIRQEMTKYEMMLVK